MTRTLLLLAAAILLQDAVRQVLDDSLSPQEREGAVKTLAATAAGGRALLALVDQGRLPEELKATASFSLLNSPEAAIRDEAGKKLPVPKFRDGKPLLPIDQLSSRVGDAKAGAAIFRDTKGPNCINCHQIADEGRFVGPPLTTIATKLSREQLYESILTPSAAVLMSYENWVVKTKDGDLKTGIKVEETDDHVTLKDTQGEFVDIPVAKIEVKKQLRMSMMPDNLVSTMMLDELVNLVEYLSQQR